MSTELTHISSATLSSSAVVGFSVVGSEVEQPDVHLQNEQAIGLHSPPQGRSKRIIRALACGTVWHKRHKAGLTGGIRG
nr:hypothetical protein CFP56_03585 [Quercus suber]